MPGPVWVRLCWRSVWFMARRAGGRIKMATPQRLEDRRDRSWQGFLCGLLISAVLHQGCSGWAGGRGRAGDVGGLPGLNWR